MADGVECDVQVLRQRLLALLEGAGNRTDLYPTQLVQQFPRIAARIAELWGKPELDRYFEKDLLTTQRSQRQGFPDEVAKELFRLSNFHSSLGLSSSAQPVPWGWVEDAEYFRRGGS